VEPRGGSAGKSRGLCHWSRPLPARRQRRPSPAPEPWVGGPLAPPRCHSAAAVVSAPRLTLTPGRPRPHPRPRQASRASVTTPSRYLGAPGRAAAGPAPAGGAEGSLGEAGRRRWERFPRRAAGEGMSANSLCLPSGGGSGEAGRRRAEATVQGSAGGQQGGRCACP
jgi:hypothetical protein